MLIARAALKEYCMQAPRNCELAATANILSIISTAAVAISGGFVGLGGGDGASFPEALPLSAPKRGERRGG
jgi:hypothetical protein